MGRNEGGKDRELEGLPEGRQEGGWKGGQDEEEDEGIGMISTDTWGQTGGRLHNILLGHYGSLNGKGAGRGELTRITIHFSFSGVRGGIEVSRCALGGSGVMGLLSFLVRSLLTNRHRE